jgi:hypothetical protein
MHGGLHRPRLQAAVHRAPGLAALDQARARQHVQVLHDRRKRDLKRRGDLGHRQLRLVRKAIDDRAPRGVGERREGKIELGAAKLNHTVKYGINVVRVKAAASRNAGQGLQAQAWARL